MLNPFKVYTEPDINTRMGFLGGVAVEKKITLAAHADTGKSVRDFLK